MHHTPSYVHFSALYAALAGLHPSGVICEIMNIFTVTEGGATDHCSKFVVVIGSQPCRTKTKESNPKRCNQLRNIEKSEIFTTDQKSDQV
jgi:hypothetical protein